MTQDYIFCPLCGGVKWIVDKSSSTVAGRLTIHKCAACKNFTYTNETVIVKHQVLMGITNTNRYSIVAEIKPYIVTVYYKEGKTVFMDSDTVKPILTVNTAVAFNWYKNEDLVNKIRKYLVFS